MTIDTPVEWAAAVLVTQIFAFGWWRRRRSVELAQLHSELCAKLADIDGKMAKLEAKRSALFDGKRDENQP